MNTIEKTGKTVDEAIDGALRALHTTLEEVEVEILDPGARGLFGIGAKPAHVSVTKKYDPVGKATKLTKELCMAMGLLVEATPTQTDRQICVDLSGENIGILIGKRGQTLDALQYIVNLAVNKGEGEYINVVLDAEGYRAKRKETLEHLAIGVAKRVRQNRSPIHLEPMTPNERRIIHSTLQSAKNVYTYSEGEEPFRYIVVEYKKQYPHQSRDKERHHSGSYNRNKPEHAGGAV